MMDDNVENDVIFDVIRIHINLLWKVISILISTLQSLLQLSGKTVTCEHKSIYIFAALLFLLVTSVTIVQNDWIKSISCVFYEKIKFKAFSNYNIRNFVASSLQNDSISQELTEGIVGVYALQGRRGAMEDKFSVMQEVEVGAANKISFFGVYDGHGGQFVAEYVKQNLFVNTVTKIRFLHSNVKERNSDKVQNMFSLKSDCQSDSKTVPVTSLPLPSAVETTTFKEDKKSIPTTEHSDTCEDINREIVLSNDPGKIEDIVKNENTNENIEEVPLKKEDPYACVKNKKRFSTPSINDTKGQAKANESKAVTNESSYIDENSNLNYAKLLNDEIINIDEKVVDCCKNKTDFSGTTAVIAVLDGELLIIGNVGDSRAVMGDLKGSAIPLSIDHKPNQLKERRRIKEAGGFITFSGVWRVAGILATSRALGDFPLKNPRKLITAEPDILTFSLKDHKADFVILATDGLWDVLSNEEAVSFIRNHIHESDYGARSLVTYAYDRGSQDNITAMVINLGKLAS